MQFLKTLNATVESPRIHTPITHQRKYGILVVIFSQQNKIRLMTWYKV